MPSWNPSICIALGCLVFLGCSSSTSHGGAVADAGGIDATGSVEAGADASPPEDAGTDARFPSAAACGDGGVPCPSGFTCAPYGLCEPDCSATKACSTLAYCSPFDAGSTSGFCTGGDYGCVGNVVYPPATSATIDVTVVLYDVSSGQVPAPNATVKACALTDASCASPVAMGTTDATGTVQLTLPSSGTGFDGYADITGPSGDGGTLMEELVFLSEPQATGGPWFSVTVSTEASLAKYWPAPIDPTRAQLVVVGYACGGSPSFGASLTVSNADSMTVLEYDGPDGLSQTATSFPPEDDNALAYAANVPAGTPTLAMSFQGAQVGTMGLGLRPGVSVGAFIAPTP
jgi:hypothetical protein